MPRRSRRWIDDCCVHVTQRCQERRYLLRFKQDRRQYLRRLRQASERHAVSVLNYMVTGNHVHLLLHCTRSEDLSAAMQLLSGSAAQDYNRRKNRSGAFWSDRFRPTLLQNGRHLSRCFFYISLNMVRACAVEHPSEWVGGSHAELMGCVPDDGPIIHRDLLLHSLECVGADTFVEWYVRTVEEAAGSWAKQRQAHWSEAAAVGSREWVAKVAERFPSPRRRVECVPEETAPESNLAEAPGTYVLRMGTRLREGLLGAME